jgi:HSP20 family protein
MKMALIPWRNKGRDGVLAPLSDLRQEIDRMFESFARNPWGSLSELSSSRDWFPPVDVVENDKEVIVRAEVPGVDPKDLDISITGDRLTISGEKKECHERKDKDFYQCETRYGAFNRTVDLPSEVDADQVQAEHSHGVLTVRLTKTAAAATKKIEVKAS